ncbi:hypothetical protein POTOM_051443 [Populus tomentosa]|uniref:Leucine-rich repeat-containing N-terminal plant-type domain-containing protein n=1 Tax=Populus tomentosa TaxID=118781 RepID=A0A8X7Y1L9_POPTO|nr:hypothetical protein POTOM_051443 [Populus tomentosa]
MKALFISLLALNLLSLSFSELCNPHDKQVLLQIKKHFGDPYLLASWLSDTDCCTSWNQVECDATTNRIVSLRIFSGDLSGEIPAEVGDLPYLETLEFHKLTNITGPITPSISNLIHLISLRLSNLNLTGPVPDSLSKLKNLRVLTLSFNSLSGSIPSSLALMPEIDILELDRNNLTGPIPESFGNFAGRVPGDASMLFGPNKTSGSVDLSRNLLEFNLSKVVFPNTLTYLDVNHNKIFGSIPTQMTQLNHLSLNVSYNRLCGQIPQGGQLQTFDYTAYFHNRCLCGAPLASCK